MAEGQREDRNVLWMTQSVHHSSFGMFELILIRHEPVRACHGSDLSIMG